MRAIRLTIIFSFNRLTFPFNRLTFSEFCLWFFLNRLTFPSIRLWILSNRLTLLVFRLNRNTNRLNACGNRLQSVYFHPFNGKPLVSVFAFQVTMISPLYLTQIIQLNGKMLFAWRKNCLSRFFLVRRSRLVIFYFKEKFCVSHASASLLRDVHCLAFWRPCRKSYISSSIWHKSFIKMVKYSFPDERIVYRSFYGAPLTLKCL